MRILKIDRIKSWFLLVVLTAGAMAQLVAQTPLTAVLEPDPTIRIGKLENGLTYYIKQNKKPANKVELRLALKAGSIQEDEAQQGLAHMAEHMAFNGTKNFKKNEIISFLQDIGVGFGNDLNAYTSFDETVYMLPIPADKPGNLEKGFQVLEDWAHNVTFLDEDIEAERAIILEESRLGKGADDRMERKILPKLFANSKYAARLPIGSEEIIKTFKPDLIRQFYRDWYRPNLMAVLVVGDVDPDRALALIKKHFSALKNPAKERPREMVKIPAYAQSEAMIVTDKEATGYSINLNYPMRPVVPDPTVAGYRKYLTRQLFSSMLNQRLQELAQSGNPPFVAAGTGFGEFVRGNENFRAVAYVGTGDIKKGLEALTAELERAERFGFTAGELDRAKKSILNNLERAYNNRDKTESQVLVDEYIEHFLSATPIPGIGKEFAIAKELLPAISIEELNMLAKSTINEPNLFLYVTGPEPSSDQPLPTEQQLLAIVAEKEKMQLTAYEEKEVASSLLATALTAGKVIKREEDKAMGLTRLTLSNGVTVSLKSTDFKADQILMGAVKNGGKNLYGVEDKFNVQFATQIVSAMGVGTFSPPDLKKALAGKTVSLSPSISEVTDGFSGSSGNKDIETLLQLVHLYMTAPRKDTALFNAYLQRSIAQYAALSSNPQAAFLDTVNSVLYNRNPLAPIVFPKVENFQAIKLDRALDIYRERLGDASGMHFAFVGSFNEQELIPLLETYLGSLPTSGRKYEKEDNQVRPVKGQQELVFRRGQEAKSLILRFYTGEIPYSEDLDLKAQAIVEILNIRVLEELREKIQGIYGGGFFAELSKYPYPAYSIVLQLPCGPEKVDTLLKAVNAEIDLLVKKGPAPSYLDKVKKQWLEQYRVNKTENSVWLSEILAQHSEQKDPKYFLQYESLVNRLTVGDIQAAAKKFFDGKNQFTAIQLPQ